MLLKVVFFSSILCFYLVQVRGQCDVSCPDSCYVNNQGVNTLCEIIIDDDKFINAGLTPLPGSVDLRLNLSGTVTKLSFVLITQNVVISLLTEELDEITNVQLNGPFKLENDFFRNFPNIQILSLDKVVFSAFPVFRYNFKLVTMECVDIEVTSGSTDIGWSFINGLDSLVSIKFVSSARFEPGYVFNGLDALTKIEFDKVDFSVAVASAFESLDKLIEVSLTNAKISNLELIPISVRNTIVELDLTNNLMNELNLDNFKGFAALTNLVLANNRFTRLVRALFLETPLLDTLDLSGNEIKTIETATFYITTNLRSVLLVGSLIRTMEYTVIAPLVSLELFALDGNLLDCDCSLFWVALFRDKFGKSFESGTNANCVAPLEEVNNKVYDSATYEKCDHNYSCFCIGSGSNLDCQGEYECLLGVPTTNAASTTFAINATIAINGTSNTTLSQGTTEPPDNSVDFIGLQISILIVFFGIIILFVLFTVVVVTIVVCCCCCNDDKRWSIIV